MDRFGENNAYQHSAEVVGVVKKIIELARPDKIYLYNQRINTRGRTSSFKLCVVAPGNDSADMERKLYLGIDCDVPFDLLVYTPQEWALITANRDSFAHKIEESGIVVYG